MADPAPSVPAVRRANKAEVAQWFEVSLPTVDAWIRKGAPVVQRGSQGVPWVLDLKAIAEWRFRGEPPADDLPPHDRRAWYQSENERVKLERELGQLVPASDAHREMAELVKVVTAGLDGLPDILERDAGIPPEAVTRVQELADAIREQLYRQAVEGEP